MDKTSVLISDASYEGVEDILPAVIERLKLTSWYKRLAGKKVFIKPNMLGLFPPDSHATTHPALVRAAVKFFQKAGAKVTVGDNCGVGGYGLNQRVAQKTGILDNSEGMYKNVSTDTKLISLRSRFMDSILVSKDMLEADFLIGLPKMKTHSLTIVTGAVKNMFGIVSGGGKGISHSRAPGIRDFGEILADIYSIRPPDLNIMDAVYAMEGNGPSAGRPKKVGKILASTNAVSLDAVMCKVMGLPPEEVHHLRILAERGAGSIDYNEIDLIGDIPQLEGFRLPATVKRFSFIGRFINGTVFRFISESKMRLDKKLCKKCRLCVDGCPVEAMQMDGFPWIDESKCIKCFCCQELCPESAWKTGGLTGMIQGRRI